MNDFALRLEHYRVDALKISTKREMAERLEVSEQLYAMFERGARKPSKSFLKKLSKYSNIPESYWLYGTDLEYIENREEFNCTKETASRLINDGFITKEVYLSDDVKDILLTALKADLKHLFLKQNK
ncbi:MAG: helix-turn-helix transcriptional regulator [Bacilli bacterium]